MCGASSGFEAATDLRYLRTREIDIRGSNGWERSDVTTVVDLVQDGRPEPVIHAVMPLSRVHDAFEDG